MYEGAGTFNNFLIYVRKYLNRFVINYVPLTDQLMTPSGQTAH